MNLKNVMKGEVSEGRERKGKAIQGEEGGRIVQGKAGEEGENTGKGMAGHVAGEWSVRG